MSKALYRKYRSKSLDEIVGQEHITGILRRAIERNKIAHAYLLTGPRGVGKTSIARILAHEINNLPYADDSQHLDIIEIDAASNNSVDDVRDLREKAQIAPVSAKRKVYIIDEVHMLSKQAFNALLKTLEEPPEHIVFLLATTDADKLPATIISRVQRLNFRPITEADAFSHLRSIAQKENIAIDDEALQLIASHGRGSFRDSIGLMDQLQHVSDDTITYQQVAQLLGLASDEMIAQLLAAYTASDIQAVVKLLDTASQAGTPAHVIADQLIAAIRRDIITRPELLPLLDDILEVSKSAWPEIKLLTALTKTAPPPLAPAAPKAPPARTTAVQPAAPLRAAPDSTSKPENTSKAQKQQENETPDTASVKNPIAFDWQSFIAAVQPKAAGAFVILKNCGHSFNGTTLTIYAGKKFNKTKLDKAQPDLSAALAELNIQADITILDTPKPPEDETTAAILDIMGGGEEIDAR